MEVSRSQPPDVAQASAASAWSDDEQPRSGALTRARTLHGALERLGLLQDSAAAARADGVLRCHILGADAREGTSVEGVGVVFLPACALLAGSCWRELSLTLCGPNCSAARGARLTPMVEVGASLGAGEREAGDGRGASPAAARLSVRFSAALYHELSVDELGAPPHVAVAFQAGVWGYDTWAPTVARVLQGGCALLVTSYTILEAEDDEESMCAFGRMRWAWRPELNPWRSIETESRLNSRGDARDLAENAAWQCVVAA